jgi:cell wall-associated NlpC family hydrolase
MACTAPPTAPSTVATAGSATPTQATAVPPSAGDRPAVAAGGFHPAVGRFDADQVANATVIVRVGAQLGVPVRGWIVAVAVAIRESSLRNVDHGDAAGPDSRGLFQQRAAWGSLAERMDPAGAARLFYTGGHHGQPGLLDIAGWQTMPVTVAAQAVQNSAFPTAYAAHEDDATSLVSAIVGFGIGLTPELCTPLPNPASAQAVAFARSQLGLPYQWGGNGPARGDAGFDCSGLTHAAYAAAGIDLPRTAQTQYDAGPHLPDGVPLLPGDLLFFGTPTNVHHVGVYIGGNQMIDAPHSGAAVRIENYHWNDYLGATRPGPSATNNNTPTSPR